MSIRVSCVSSMYVICIRIGGETQAELQVHFSPFLCPSMGSDGMAVHGVDLASSAPGVLRVIVSSMF